MTAGPRPASTRAARGPADQPPMTRLTDTNET